MIANTGPPIISLNATMASVMSRPNVPASTITWRGSSGSYRTPTVAPCALPSPCWCGSGTSIRCPSARRERDVAGAGALGGHRDERRALVRVTHVQRPRQDRHSDAEHGDDDATDKRDPRRGGRPARRRAWGRTVGRATADEIVSAARTVVISTRPTVGQHGVCSREVLEAFGGRRVVGRVGMRSLGSGPERPGDVVTRRVGPRRRASRSSRSSPSREHASPRAESYPGERVNRPSARPRSA